MSLRSQEHCVAAGRLPRHDNGKNRELISKIVRMLLANPDIEKKDEQMCEVSAENAIQKHPELQDASELIDPAYAMYLEFTQP